MHHAAIQDTTLQNSATPSAGRAAPAVRFAPEHCSLRIEDLHLAYAGKPALGGLSLDIPRHRITAFIGPSGCGKSTLLRAINRLHDLNPDVTCRGRITFEGEDIHHPQTSVAELRRRVGMVFQSPNPFPLSVYENVAFGLRLQNRLKKRQRDDAIEWALRAAALWDEVKDSLHTSAWQLSGGQQQRLVIARALAVKPDILLLDEPASALDPISTLKIEELMDDLKHRLTLVLVTHNMQQAARISDYTAFIDQGRLVEYAATDEIFTNPRLGHTENYITGRMTGRLD